MKKSEFVGKYCIVRTYSAGCFAGVVKSLNGKEAVITDCRRLWYWAGAASLSQLAMSGTTKPEGCKFPEPTGIEYLSEVIEVMVCTPDGRKSIEKVPVWKA